MPRHSPGSLHLWLHHHSLAVQPRRGEQHEPGDDRNRLAKHHRNEHRRTDHYRLDEELERQHPVLGPRPALGLLEQPRGVDAGEGCERNPGIGEVSQERPGEPHVQHSGAGRQNRSESSEDVGALDQPRVPIGAQQDVEEALGPV